MGKKGSVTLMKTIVGVVIGIVILVFLFIILKPFIPGGNEDASLQSLHDKLVETSKGGPYTGDKVLLNIKEGTVIIGFGPKESTTNGRFGNGEFFYMFDKKDKQDFNSEAFTREPLYFDRADASGCSDDQACLCLCKDPTTDDPTQEEIDQRSITASASPNPYQEPWVTDAQRQQFMRDPADRMYRKLACEALTCTPIEAMAFHTPMPCSCYYEGEDETDCGYTFENGFAIYRRKSSYSSTQGVAYENKLPPSVQVSMEVLPDGKMAVALNSLCLLELEEKVLEGK